MSGRVPSLAMDLERRIADESAVPRDERLRLARRIDWRFLLDAPVLGRVLVGGSPDEDLLAALDAATTDEGSRNVVGRIDGVGATTLADTVVLAGADARDHLAAAARSVAPGGRLVIEVEGPVRLDRRRPLRIDGLARATRIARSLRAAGWTVRVWWAWPDRDRATAWAAIDDAPAVRALLGRRLDSGPLAAIGRLVSTGVGRQVVGLVGPTLTVVARRADELRSFPESRLPDDGPAGPGRQGPGMLVLTPRYRASAHVVALAIDPGRGGLRHVVKVARLPDDQGLAHERAVLARLTATLADDGRWPVPGSPDAGATAWPLLVERALVGRPLSADRVRADRPAAVRRTREMLEALPVGDAQTRVGTVADRLDAALATVDALDDPSLSGLVHRSRPVLAALHDARLPVVFEHGDAAHPNLIELPDGRLGAVDWERGEPDGLPLHDLTIALAYVAAADRGATGSVAQAAAFVDALDRPDAWGADALDGEAERLAVDARLRPALVVSTWVRSVAWLATAIGASAAGRESVRWLAADRAVSLWDASLSLAEAR